MQLTTALLAGALASAVKACTPDFNSFEISEFSQTYVPLEGTTWSFSLTRPTNHGLKLLCHGWVPSGQKDLAKGTCGEDQKDYFWITSGYTPKHITSYQIAINQTIAPCPPGKYNQNFLFATENLKNNLTCSDDQQTRGGKQVKVKHCVNDGIIYAAHNVDLKKKKTKNDESDNQTDE